MAPGLTKLLTQLCFFSESLVMEHITESYNTKEERELAMSCSSVLEVIASYLHHSVSSGSNNTMSCAFITSSGQFSLSRPMQKKLGSLLSCQLATQEGRMKLAACLKALAERCITELILQHQHPHQLSSNLWGAVRSRGCQFLGPGKIMSTITIWA